MRAANRDGRFLIFLPGKASCGFLVFLQGFEMVSFYFAY